MLYATPKRLKQSAKNGRGKGRWSDRGQLGWNALYYPRPSQKIGTYWNSIQQSNIRWNWPKAVVQRNIKKAQNRRSGAISTRGLVERLSIECNKLFNAVVKADVDTLPDDFDTLEVIAGFKTVAKNSGFQLVKKSKK